ncbi:MAG: hypothetical protein ABIG68_02040 [Acidobacteriota bacterium]
MLPSYLPRAEIRRIFRQHRGSAAALARRLGVTATSVSLWLHGRRQSARLEREIRAAAEVLAEREAKCSSN